MPGASAEPVCSCAHPLSPLRTRPPVQRAPGIPCTLPLSRANPVRTGRIAPRDHVLYVVVLLRKTVAGELGFEPRQTELEFVVLPLHHSPKFHNNINALTACCAVARDGCGNPFRCGAVLLAPSRAWQARGGILASFRDGGRAVALFTSGEPLASPSRQPAYPQGKRRRRRLWANLPLQTRHAMLQAAKNNGKGGATTPQACEA